MEIELEPVESRIVGVLLEKQMATPEYYPLTLNALINACNQKTNREPVMNLDEDAVVGALHRLRQEKLVWQVRTHGSRAAKYEHAMGEITDFSRRELALLALLMLRGPQTVGELKTRSARMVEFQSLREVEYTLNKLMEREKGPFVARLPRKPGHKESRYAQLFCSTDEADTDSDVGNDGHLGSSEKSRIDELEAVVDDMAAQLKALKSDFEAFRKQFE